MAKRKRNIIPVELSEEEWQATRDRARIQGVTASSLLRLGLRIVLSQPIKHMVLKPGIPNQTQKAE
jgi:hypothetical protein